MEILKLNCACKEYLWGGNKLKKNFHKKFDGEILAETWELSCHKDGYSTIQNGTYKGRTLLEYITENKQRLGKNCERFEEFPILIKFIDSKEPLSVQVHPDNRYALKKEGQYGKTEMWYVLDCDEDSYLYYGFQKPVTKEEFKKAVEQGTLEQILNKIHVKKGDVFFIESRTIHAIGKGITIAEIQQNSNVTYRVYDYNRVGTNGKKRELHIDKALEVTNTDFIGKKYHFGNHMVSCDIFNVGVISVIGEKILLNADDSSFHSLIITDGKGKICYKGKELDIQKGDSVFVPAGIGEYTVEGSVTIIKTMIPEKMTYTVGVDIGGTTIKIGIIDKNNNIILKKEYPTESGWQNVVTTIANAIEYMLQEAGISKQDCSSIGIGCPGTVDVQSGDVIYSNNLKWSHVTLKQEIEQKTNMKVYVENDANCAALGEVKAGFSEQYENAVLITIGTGIGSGVIMNGKILEGGIGSMEIGHTVAVKNGKVCSCGRKGCLEAYASATALIEQAKEAAAQNKESELYKMCQGKLENMNGKIPFDAAKIGDKTALQVIENYTDYLAEGMIDAINLFRPELLLLGGGVSKQGRYIVDILRKKIMPHVFGGENSYIPQISCALLENDAGMIGAANLCNQ